MSLKRIIYVLVIAFVAVAAALSGAVAGGVAVYMAVVSNNPTTTTQAPVQAVSTGNTTLNLSTTQIETTITQAVATAGPSVVTVVGTIKGQRTFFGQSPDQQVSGSGVIVSSTGYVVTNNHVVENTDSVSVILANGKALSGSIVGTDQFSDLAVIKVQGQMPAVATLGNSDALKPGESVIAIGSPLGDLKNTVTVGVVSATGRSIDTRNGYQLVDMIQTDAAINHGNSGGPLVNLNGEVIAINTLIVRGSGFSGDIAEGLGFAIPSNTAKAVAEQIIQKGYVSRPYIGIQWQWITPSISAMYSLPVQWGAYVSQIDSGSPAEKSGLQRGDIITRIGDTALDDSQPYINALYQHAPGDTVKLEVIRGDKTLDIEVTLGESR